MKTVIVVLSAILLSFIAPHPHHITIMQLDFNEANKSFETTLKGFTDDFELGLKNFTGKPVYLEKIQGNDSASQVFEQYIRKHLAFKIDGNSKDFNWVGWEIDRDEVFIYVEIKTGKKVKSVEIMNELLFNEYSDQTNIVHLKYGSANKSLYLNKADRVKSFELE